ncbi:hypothetical protein C2845_PM06G29290 [Panicum miliaceum]|uniref:Protein kinase domain-containing protein n=1 Tax=Panicum miliaceum TaxID=4540 RepID=A0A3L6RD21_PANMI|nr:hypothetical protein C2845_PM06G29290 [Panicum miliaceum]
MAFSLSFDFDFSKQPSLSLQGGTKFEENAIELTEKGSENSVGRASYLEPVAIWDKVSGELTSFTTTFSFQILPDPYRTGGDGMAFFLGHYPSVIPASSAGGSLGLFSSDTANAFGNSRAVAVELDTFMDADYDSSSNHIGIDVNSLISTAYTDTNLPGRNLTSGRVMTCRISYVNSTQRLAAELQIGNASYRVDSVVDLRQQLPSVVAVGFSAATSVRSELHRVLAWSFESTLEGPRGPAAVPSPSSPFTKGVTWKIVVVAITGAAVTVIVPIVIAGYVCLRRRSRRKANTRYETTPANVARSFSYRELAEATHNFAEEQKLGEGGYACVYSGELATPRRSVAIKRFKPGTSSAICTRAFDDEIKVISQVRHRNLVELVGWCTDGKKHRLLLVYELVAQGNLDQHLHGSRSWLSWTMRYGTIEDLLY